MPVLLLVAEPAGLQVGEIIMLADHFGEFVSLRGFAMSCELLAHGIHRACQSHRVLLWEV